MTKGNMKSKNKHQYELDQLYLKVKASGGRNHCHDLFKKYNREHNAHKKRNRPKPSYDLQITAALYRSMKEKEFLMKMEKIVILNDFGKKNLSWDISTLKMEVDGKSIKYNCHPNNRYKPTPQLTEEVLSNVSTPLLIDESSPAVSKIVFPNGRINYVFLAKRDSKCDALTDLHRFLYDENGSSIQSHLDIVPKSMWEKDALGGGRYLPMGYGTMGRHLGCDQVGYPHVLKSLLLEPVKKLAHFSGGLMTCVARCIKRYSPAVIEENQRLKEMNRSVAYPFLETQDGISNFFSSQTIIRNFGPTKDTDIIATHCDSWDVSTLMPLVYKSGGGKDNLDGPVSSTDIVIFEHAMGGAALRVKTNMRDVVVVILMNSNQQLHGGVKSAPDFVFDDSAITTRFISFITQGVMNWTMKTPGGKPCRCNMASNLVDAIVKSY